MARTGPAILYVTTQKQAEELATYLTPCGLEAMVYHAGLPNEQRTSIQMQFMQSEKGIVCATIAFGMGIDKGELISAPSISVATSMFRQFAANIRQVGIHIFTTYSLREGFERFVTGRAF